MWKYTNYTRHIFKRFHWVLSFNLHFKDSSFCQFLLLILKNVSHHHQLNIRNKIGNLILKVQKRKDQSYCKQRQNQVFRDGRDANHVGRCTNILFPHATEVRGKVLVLHLSLPVWLPGPMFRLEGFLSGWESLFGGLSRGESLPMHIVGVHMLGICWSE